MADELYNNFDKSLYRINSSVYQYDLPVVDSSVPNIDSGQIESGSEVEQLIRYVGANSAGKLGFTNNETGYILGIDAKDGIPKFYIGNTVNYLNWDGNTLTISGTISATTGFIGGFEIGADYIRDIGNTFGLASTVTGGNDVRFWAGAAFASRSTAPLRVYEDGSIIGTNATFTGALFATSGWIGSATALVYESQGINTGTTGFIRGGQTSYNTGTGYFLGYDTGQYKLSIGNTTNYLTWNGTTLEIAGIFNIGGTTITIDNSQDIQTYLDLIDASGGGTLFLQPGTYTLTADIIIPSGIVLEGVSRDTVIIDCNTSYSVKMTGTDTYSTGTVVINNGDTTVVGTGTTWTAGMIGRSIFLQDQWYEITARADNTHITIGSTYNGTNLSGATYALANIISTSSLIKVTVTGATSSGIVVAYARECNIFDVFVYNCATGIDMDYVQFPQIRCSSVENDVNLNMNWVVGFFIDYSEFGLSTSSHGVIMTDTSNATFFNSSVVDNTGDGINMTNCDTIAFISFDISGNGGQGVEMVSGCDDNQFAQGLFDSNGSDGVKFTATSDRNTIVAVSITNSGGYGVNIAASTCDNNQIIAPAFDNNSSGNINDQGTNTFISPQESITGIVVLMSTIFEATGRLSPFGTDDATTAVGINGLDMSAGAAQNAGRTLNTQIGQNLSTAHSIVGLQVRPRNGEGSGEVCYVGMGENTGLTITDSAITFTSRSNYGIKMIGDGSTQDVYATNAERGGSETSTLIISNPPFTDPINVHSMEYIGGISIIWREFDNTILATHTTNLPTTGMTNPAGQFVVTQNTQIWVPSFSLSTIL